MTTTNPVYAYVHCKPDGTPFYVGKGRLKRAKRLYGRNTYHTRTVNKYGKENLHIGMLECSSDDNAFLLERGLIKCLKRMGVKLTNHTEGGEGGKPPSEQGRLNMSEAAKKRGVSQACRDAMLVAITGRKKSDEEKLKQSIRMTGRVFTDEHKKNISIGAKKRGVSKACREACVVANTGSKKPHSEETKLKMSNTVKGRPMSEACVAAKKLSQEARKRSPEQIKEYQTRWYLENKQRFLDADKRTPEQKKIDNRVKYLKHKAKVNERKLEVSI